MFVMTIITTALYFRVFIEMEKTQNSIDFKQKTLAQLNED